MMLIKRISIAAVAMLVCLTFSNDLMAQRGGRGGGGQRGGGGNTKLQLLGNEQVQEELGIVDDQLEGLKDVESMTRDIMREVFSGMREKFNDLSGDERSELMDELRGEIRERMQEVNTKLEDVLLPHQVERLDQIVLQMSIRQRGVAGAMQSGEMQELLGLDDEDAEKLKEKEEEVKKELDEKIAKLREEARDEVLSVLPADKQEEIKKLLGDSFQMSNDRRGGGGQRGGGGGGQRGGGGGQRGGPGGGDGPRDM